MKRIKKLAYYRLIRSKYLFFKRSVQKTKKKRKFQKQFFNNDTNNCFYQISTIDCPKNQKSNYFFEKLSQRKPLKLTKCPKIMYFLPSKLHVIAVRQAQGQGNFLESHLIPYQQEVQDNVLLTQIPAEEFLAYQGPLNLSVAQMQLNSKKVSLPGFIHQYFREKKGGIATSSLQSVNLWHYKGLRTSKWHYDGHDNFLFQLKGRKKIFTRPPNFIRQINKDYIQSKSSFSTNNNHAFPDDFEGFSKKTKKIFTTCLSQGDCLFIPRGWWHYVQSYGQDCIALNVWGNSLKIVQEDYQPMLKYLMCQIGESIYKSQNLKINTTQSDQFNRRISFLQYLREHLC